MKIIILIFLTICSIFFSKEIITSINISVDIWKSTIFPSLFPFFIMSELLINYGLVKYLTNITKPIMTKVFKINPECAFIFIMSIISGFPSSAKYTNELLNKSIITNKDANKIMLFSHFSNPVFILTTLSLFLNNKKICFLILFTHYITNIIIGIIFRNYNAYTKTGIKVNNHQQKPFSIILNQSIKNTITTLILILGSMTTCIILITIITNLFNLNTFNQSIITSLIEITQGLKAISNLNISLQMKATIITFMLSFGSISIHSQVTSIVKINYLYYFSSRILHAIISALLTYILYGLIT